MNSDAISSERLVFVGGLHRSGTTAFADALGQHSEVSGLTDTGVIENEGQFLQDVYPTQGRAARPGRFAQQRRSHLTERSRLVSRDASRRLLASWSPYWDTTRKLLVEKSPPNLIRTRFLQELFPDAAHVIVLRHPVAVALATQKWAYTRSLHALIQHNLHAYRLFEADSARLRRVLVLRYEDLVADPAGVMSGVQQFLGLITPVPVDGIQPGHNASYDVRWEQVRSEARGLDAMRYRWSRSARQDLARWGYGWDSLTKVSPRQL